MEEKKKNRDAEEAAKVYEEFVKDFGDAGSEPGTKTFVRGGVMQPGHQPQGLPSNQQEKQHYTPTFMPPAKRSKPNPKLNLDEEDDDDDANEEEQRAILRHNAQKGKPRSIDLLLADLKKDQEERAQRKEQGLAPVSSDAFPPHGSYDQGDETSTNLYVGNVHPDIDERMLAKEFGRFGPIGSVKIMWPRDEDQRRRGKNTGFVAFMKRTDAEAAREALDGVMLKDLQLVVGWGKAVPLPPVPVWPPPAESLPGSFVAVAPDYNGGSPFPGTSYLPPAHPAATHQHMGNAPPPTQPSVAMVPQCPPRPALPHAMHASGAAIMVPSLESTRQRAQDGPPPKQEVVGMGPDIHVLIPADPRQRFVIDAMAYYVLQDGCDFEQAIMENEYNNPEFSFLFDVTSSVHVYYRWRLFALSNGDSLRSWRVDPFLMVEKSNRWNPPAMTMLSASEKILNSGGSMSGRFAEKKDEIPLSPMDKQRFSHMLCMLSVERQAVCDVMAFAMDHADSATEVSEMIIESINAEGVPSPHRIATLFVMSDILHNTSTQVRHATRYRKQLQNALPDVFECLQDAYRSCESRMAQEVLRKHVLKVLRVWRGWFIFSDDYLNGLQGTFLRGGTGPGGVNLMDITVENASNKSLVDALNGMTDDELELKCKHSGLSIQGGREKQTSRMLSLDIYLNGAEVR